MTLMNPFHFLQRFLLDKTARLAVKFDFRQRHKLASILAAVVIDGMRIRWQYVVEILQQRLALTREEAIKLGRKIYISFIENSIEMATIPFLTAQEMNDRLRPEGLHYLSEAIAGKRGAIIISGHYGVWEFIPPWLALNGFEVTIVVRRQSNKLVDDWMEKMRNAHGAKTTDSGYGIREILRALREGHCLALMSDQDSGDKGIFVDFFDNLASTPVGPAQIAIKTGVPIVPVAAHRMPYFPHIFEVHPPIYPENYATKVDGAQLMTQAYTDILESWIRKRPDQWFWLHRRWKTRPLREKARPVFEER